LESWPRTTSSTVRAETVTAPEEDSVYLSS
jgi:hypothetical protein